MKLAALFITCILACTSLAQDTFESLLKRGDAFDSAMKTKEALEVYLKAEKLQPKNAELLHRIAKQYGETMNDVRSEADKKSYAQKCLDTAKRAVEADPANPLAQVALAVAYGRIAPFLDNKTKISYSKLVKEHAEKAIAADPNCELAYHVLGAWNYELAGFGAIMRTLTKLIYGELPAASYAEAERNFKKAIALNSKRVANFVELGRTYIELGDKTKAKENLAKGIALPSIYRDDDPTKDRARAALKGL